MTWATQLTNLSPGIFVAMLLIAFAAGAIRGFAGFALSAFVMACAATLIAPIELIPMLWFLEMSASLILMKGGWQDANRSIAIGLFVTSAIGLPAGLLLNLALPVTASKIIALCLLITLAALQLAKIRLPFLATKPGLYASGFSAGVVTGLAGLGGMFIALYVLARQMPAREMRGSLNIYMLGGGALGLITHLLIGTMDQTAATRGLLFMLPCIAGVFLGKALFTPKYEPYYKPLCLTLLIGLAALGLLRLSLQG